MGASRPTAARTAAAIPVGPKQKIIRRGGIYPARRRSRRHGVCGTMRASSPTEVCYNVGMSFPGWPRHLPLAVGADCISARGRSRRRGVPGTMRASSPTEVCYNVGMSFPGWPRHLPLAVGADSISARGRSRRRRVRRDGASRPTAARTVAAFPFSLKHKIYS